LARKGLRSVAWAFIGPRLAVGTLRISMEVGICPASHLRSLPVEHSAFSRWIGAGVFGILIVGAITVGAQPPDASSRPVYQRHASGQHWRGNGWNKRGFGHAPNWSQPQVNSGWYQRPYPYHLDYYKMRYGGSYAPYFGNLYGPPQVVTAPPYYGPYYGEYGGGGFAQPGQEMYPVEYPPSEVYAAPPGGASELPSP